MSTTVIWIIIVVCLGGSSWVGGFTDKLTTSPPPNTLGSTIQYPTLKMAEAVKGSITFGFKLPSLISSRLGYLLTCRTQLRGVY